MDQSINSLGDELLSNIHGYHRGLYGDPESWSYDEFVQLALDRIEGLWKYRHHKITYPER